jgi:hypothetical protein
VSRLAGLAGLAGLPVCSSRVRDECGMPRGWGRVAVDVHLEGLELGLGLRLGLGVRG